MAATGNQIVVVEKRKLVFFSISTRRGAAYKHDTMILNRRRDQHLQLISRHWLIEKNRDLFFIYLLPRAAIALRSSDCMLDHHVYSVDHLSFNVVYWLALLRYIEWRGSSRKASLKGIAPLSVFSFLYFFISFS